MAAICASHSSSSQDHILCCIKKSPQSLVTNAAVGVSLLALSCHSSALATISLHLMGGLSCQCWVTGCSPREPLLVRRPRIRSRSRSRAEAPGTSGLETSRALATEEPRVPRVQSPGPPSTRKTRPGPVWSGLTTLTPWSKESLLRATTLIPQGRRLWGVYILQGRAVLHFPKHSSYRRHPY